MFCAGDKASRSGFTIVEIMITIAILGILVVLAVGNFRGMNEKYKVEAETKQLYADLMDARGRAMQRNRMFFVRFSGTSGTTYAIYEDTDTTPDGNGDWSTADTIVANMTVAHTINTNLAGGVFVFEFNRNGISSVAGDIHFFSSTAKPDYDCITVKPTRIKMGQYIGGGCVEK